MTLLNLPAAAGRLTVALRHIAVARRGPGSAVARLRSPRLLLAVLLAIAVTLALLGGALAYVVEREDPAGHIHSVADGVWWAAGTIATVGYGDKVPVTVAGRIIGIALMMAGLALLATTTAVLASTFVTDDLAARRRALRQARRTWHDLRRNLFLNMFAIASALALVGGYVVYQLETVNDGSLYTSYWDGVWWAVVTMTSVGYGDRYPVTALGRVVAMVLMVGGLAAVSLMTANFASGLVSESLKEARGLETIRWRGHILLCGWNQHAERVIDNLVRSPGPTGLQLVLVNQLPEDAVNNILYKYRDIRVRYVRGSHTDEPVLERANVNEATAAVVLADMSAGTASDADDRTVLAVLALKHLNSSLRVTAEVLDAQNAVHLRRASADEVVVSGEHNPFLLAAAVASPGLLQASRILLGGMPGAELRRVAPPPHLLGATFGEVAAYLRSQRGDLALGLITEHKGVTLDDMLGSETSWIDDFIRRKFTEAGLDQRTWDTGGVAVVMNPYDYHLVGPNDSVIVLGRSLPAPS